MYFTHIFVAFPLKSREAKITVHESSTYNLSMNALQLCYIDVDGHHREKCEFHCVFLHESSSIRNPASLNGSLEFRDALILGKNQQFLSAAHPKIIFIFNKITSQKVQSGGKLHTIHGQLCISAE